MEISKSRFKNIYYQYINDDKQKDTLLFLHGFTGSSAVWNSYIEILKNHFNILTLDLTGHGLSDSPKTIDDYLFQKQSDYIAELLQILKISSLSIISYSFSCCISLLLLEKIPKEINSLVFIGPYIKEKNNIFSRTLFTCTKPLWNCLVTDKKFFLDYSKIKNYENPKFQDTKYILKCTNTKDIVGSIYAMKDSDMIKKLLNLQLPALIIYGEKDKIFSTKIKEDLKAKTNIQFKIIENKKHLFLKTAHLQIIKILQDFFTQ